MSKSVALFFVLLYIIDHSNGITFKLNSDPRIRHNKQKRDALFWQGPNIVKTVLGVSYPLETYDKVNFRTLNLAYNFQGQYMLTRPAKFPWEKAKRSLQNQKEDNLYNNSSTSDNTRHEVYNVVEALMDRNGVNGKECIQRAICENTQSPIIVTGVVAEIVNLFLSPTEKDVDKFYIDAKNAGFNGADCLLLYKSCPTGHGIFDSLFKFVTR